MALSTLTLMQTAERFGQRKTEQAKKEKRLQSAQLQLAKSDAKAFQLLMGLDAKERVAKRLNRLQNNLPALQLENDGNLEAAMAKRLIGKNDLLQASFLDKGSLVAKSVGRVVLKNSNRQVVGFGTGFLIAPRLLLTNHHVLPTRADALYSHLELNYGYDTNGNFSAPVTFSFDTDTFFYTSNELDMTVIALNGNAGDHFGWNKLIEEEGKVMIGEYMNIIQHPDGRPKELSIRSNRLMDVLPHFLHYKTDTEPGSSGAPVYNDQWELVALHHSGVPQRNSSGQILTRDGKVWQPEMGEAQVHWIGNEGIRVSALVKHLKNLKLTGDEKKRRNEIFDLDNRQVVADGSNGINSSNIQLARSEATIQIVNNELQIDLPIQIKIARSDFSIFKNDDGIASQQEVTSGAATLVPAFEKRLQTLLKEVATARSKPYYNKAEDAKHKKQYYQSLKTTGKSSDALFSDLNQLLQQTHTKPLNYEPSKYVYTWVDWQPDQQLRSVYSLKQYTPEELLQEDMAVEMQHEKLVQQIANEKGKAQNALENELDLLEASLPYNCEHVVPQSWFGKKEPMRGDLHHLFTCEWGCNSFRNKIPYYDFADFEEVVRTDCGKRETNQFEPGNGKGAVARATLYFLLRYPGQINAISKHYTADSIKMLLHWHQTHKVSEHELHRNAAIFALQGNRNPLIDHPEWATKINFAKGLAKRN